MNCILQILSLSAYHSPLSCYSCRNVSNHAPFGALASHATSSCPFPSLLLPISLFCKGNLTFGYKFWSHPYTQAVPCCSSHGKRAPHHLHEEISCRNSSINPFIFLPKPTTRSAFEPKRRNLYTNLSLELKTSLRLQFVK